MIPYKSIIDEVAVETGLSPVMVEKIYRAYWRSVKEHMTSLPLKNELSDEQFLSLQPNVNIPSIGKLYLTLDRYKRIMETNNEIKSKNYDAH